MSRSSSKSKSAHTGPPQSARIRIANESATPDRDGPIPSSLSLLTARRPSWAPPLYDHTQEMSVGLGSYRDVPSFGTTQTAHPSSSPEDGGNFRRNLQIDMKELVGDAVGNMSISPASRDIVLAARRGLFIIDLEAPLEVPRFLPQGGTWDVADVQWNPHRARAEYIVSTSSEKLLIWNLMLVGKTSIEYILHSHYRAITDINWHTSEPDTVASVGIDAWVWSWDLRYPRKPVLGLCAFNAGGTQVKWNRKDPNVLASSHMNEVLIWDRRKGSLPTARIKAHTAKIYGIDWAHERKHDLVTCSLDKTIKVWDAHDAPSFSLNQSSQAEIEPRSTISTRYPVWRARNLPFGHGVLSLPQRGDTTLEMYTLEGSEVGTPVEVFEGHADVVKEFVWRKGGLGGEEHQLITWSKDRTLRFWPVDAEIMEKVGHTATTQAPSHPHLQRSRFFTDKSFRHPPTAPDAHPSFLSAPIGPRGILAEVRANTLPPRVPTTTITGASVLAIRDKDHNPVLQPHHGSAARARGALLLDAPGSAALNIPGIMLKPHIQHIPGTPATMTMTRGHALGGRSARMDAFQWLASIKVGERREDSASGPESRLSSGERREVRDGSVPSGQKRKRSGSRIMDGEGTQSLQDEITSALTKLQTSKIKLEKHDLMKRRTCTLGLHGPWGESSSVSVFIRVSFRFPKTYPQSGVPDIDLERNPLVSMQSRAFMLRRLRGIRERRRPCLEACLRFLLFGDEDERVGIPRGIDSESSNEEEEDNARKGEGGRKSRDFTVSLLRNNKNLAEPRTSQGVFGPNGELVCFFRAPPRIVRNPMNEMSASPATTPASRSSPSAQRLFQSPALLSDAVRRLGMAAIDRDRLDSLPQSSGDNDTTMRIMTNLLTFSHHHHKRRESMATSASSLPTANPNYAKVPVLTRRSTVFIEGPTDTTFAQRKVAEAYVFGRDGESVGAICEANAKVAHEHGQWSHERVWMTLRGLFPTSVTKGAGPSTVARKIIDSLYKEYCASHDVQMLAMLGIILLRAFASLPDTVPNTPSANEPSSISPTPEEDYFSLVRRKGPRAGALSPGWPRLSSTSPTAPPLMISSLSMSNSSRGSWSSLFNTGSMRQFMSGVQESISTPLSIDTLQLPTRTPMPMPSPLPGSESAGSVVLRLPNLDTPRRRKGSTLMAPISKSWSDTSVLATPAPAAPLSPAVHGRRPTFSQVISPKQVIHEKRLVIEEEPIEEKPAAYDQQILSQFKCHVLAYAEMLFRWELLNKRLELLKSAKITTLHSNNREAIFDVQHACGKCNRTLDPHIETCSCCGLRTLKPRCSLCRLPVKGLSRTCGNCLHVTHLGCWRDAMSNVCGSGCGCRCRGELRPDSQAPIVQSPTPPPSALSR
ncbi:hypothetical protein DEU56DRAFT_978948 [Suillus clintonianus]|uniref:uncharacterized protein n=1 Tax=Suillus clintonianus TaxID=1904413 RepID=UPI001B8839BD|nr:uncharacterized protein DEU56DRAFT_978948 [Suillus clintonianus]KAG2145097.1 hypothetical protein DEU56DRAFT_978948 [Suillus clintonianus]